MGRRLSIWLFILLAAGAAALAMPVHADVPQLPDPVGSDTRAVTSASAGEDLVGLFRVKKGDCITAGVSGSSFRMIQKGSTLQNPTYVPNSDSPCTAENRTFTPLTPGTDGGLATNGFQPNPSLVFDSTGGGRNDKIALPAKWFSVNFSVATNEKDPQTGLTVTSPKVTHDGAGGLSGDLRAFAAAWNNQHFNQGSPKPDGTKPGNTTAPAGTYNPSTKAYSLDWTSYIQGGPFDGFTGKWHIEGTFESGTQAPGVQPATPKQARVSGGRLAATGANTSALGLVLLALAIAGLLADRAMGREPAAKKPGAGT